jgi:Lon protease-like protein
MLRRLPVFPLGTVLVPHGLLPLHVFEERYRALMVELVGDADDTRHDAAEMGVVLIERGQEVGGGDERSTVGTIARLIRAERFPDGRWFVLAVGTQRFSVSEWLPDDPYPQAQVEVLAEEHWDAGCDHLLRSAEHEVRRALSLAGELGDPATQPDLDPDPLVATWQLCDAVPVGPFDRQRLLAATSVAERLELLAEQAREAASLLAFRLGGA